MIQEWETAIHNHLERSAFWDRLLPRLTDRELHTLILWWAGRSLVDSARIQGISETRVMAVRRNIRIKAKHTLRAITH